MIGKGEEARVIGADSVSGRDGEDAAMFDAGVTDFVELGGKVLSPLVKRTAPDATATSVMTMDDIEALTARI